MQVLIYGAGLLARTWLAYRKRQGIEGDVVAFAVTNGEAGNTLCGLPVLPIAEVADQFPSAAIEVVLQEKFHSEVLQTLRAMGRVAACCYGLKDLCRMLAIEAQTMLARMAPEWVCEPDPYDFSMMRVYPTGHAETCYKLYPMLSVPFAAEDVHPTLESLKTYALTGPPWREKVTDAAEGNHTIFIGMACSSLDRALPQGYVCPPFEHPVFGGAVFAGDLSGWHGYRDDAGEHLSYENRNINELTVAYWMWKNVRDADYLGLSHYRRHFRLTEGVLAGLRAGEIDVVLTRPRLSFSSVRQDFIERSFNGGNEKNYQALLDVLERHGDRAAAERYFCGHVFFPNNMVIARREIYDAYCHWLFPILHEYAEAVGVTEEERQHRFVGYRGEVLSGLFIVAHGKEWVTAVVDYEMWE